MSVIANGTFDGEPLAEHEALSCYVTIAAAGHDTTGSTAAREASAEPGAAARRD